MAAFGSPQDVAERFGSDVAGRSEAALSRAMSAVELLTLKHPWRGAALRAGLVVVPFALIFLPLAVISESPRADVAAPLAVAASAWILVNGIRFRAVMNRAEVGLNARLGAWSREHPVLHLLAITSFIWAYVGYRVVTHGMHKALVPVLLIFAAMASAQIPRAENESDLRPSGENRSLLNHVRRFIPQKLATRFLVLVAVVYFARQGRPGVIAIAVMAFSWAVAIGIGAIVTRSHPEPSVRRRVSVWAAAHPWLATLLFVSPTWMAPIVVVLLGREPLSDRIAVVVTLSAIGSTVAVVLGVMVRQCSRTKIDHDLETRASTGTATEPLGNHPTRGIGPHHAEGA